jgi:hypothetical protein
MFAISLCVVCFLISYLAGRRSLVYGLLAVIGVGYAYGILRANLLNPFAHFIFDAGLIGLYLSQPWHASHAERKRTGQLRVWTAVLISWPVLICLLPFQTFLISLVGLRGNIFMLPALLLGARLRDKDLTKLAYGLAGLNILALAFAAAEYFLGVERFFPFSEVTTIMYASNDVAGYRFLRIPSTFVSAAAFAGAMVVTLPFLYAAWSQLPRFSSRWFVLLLVIGGSILGVLMGASRLHFIVASVLILVAALGGGVRPVERVAWFTLILVLASLALSNERFQRFQSLSDKEMVANRFAGSVNRTFWEILTEYPMGNGLGGGGTSIPYFLQGQVKTPIQMENEYARILLEQGLIGLLLWVIFIFWAFSRRAAFEANPWRNGRRLAWFCCACYFGTGLIGIGLLTAIPQSMLMFLLVGWITVRQAPETRVRGMAPEIARNRREQFQPA